MWDCSAPVRTAFLRSTKYADVLSFGQNAVSSIPHSIRSFKGQFQEIGRQYYAWFINIHQPEHSPKTEYAIDRGANQKAMAESARKKHTQMQRQKSRVGQSEKTVKIGEALVPVNVPGQKK